jgi:UDP-N-acetylglucosamine 2-epimerase (non-hydrolysing)
MIAVVYGTTGELIKLAPLLVRLRESEVPTLTLCTGQQVEQIPELLDDLGLPQPDVWLGRGRRGHDLERMRDIPAWFAQVGATFASSRRASRTRIVSGPTKPLLVVHGDTLTTVLGALMGRSMRIPVAHVEAGMRSGDWRNPFPEELDRRIAARLARIHFAPSSQAAANLRAMHVRGEIVDTGGNTIRDALELVPASAAPAMGLPPEPFGLASLHRSELLGRPTALRRILELLHEVSRRAPILFIDHPVTVAAITKHRLDSLFDERFRRVPRQRYFAFIALLKASTYLVTDSGGSQEECAQLGHPCLVHRAVTERFDGLDGGSVVLSRMSLEVVREFLADPLAHACPPPQDAVRPTDAIIRYLEGGGYLPRARKDAETPILDHC